MGTPASIRVLAVVEIMRTAALAGQVAPANAALAGLLGITSTGTASEAVSKAEALGLIVVQRGQNARVIAAPDGAWRTAGHIGIEHAPRVAAAGEGHRKRGPGQNSAASLRAARRVQKPRVVGLAHPRAAGRRGFPLPGPVAHQIPAPAGEPRPAVMGQVPGFSRPALLAFPPSTAPAVERLPGAFSEGCRYPMGDVRAAGFRFCDEPRAVYPGGRRSAYCLDHHAICYRRDDAA